MAVLAADLGGVGGVDRAGELVVGAERGDLELLVLAEVELGEDATGEKAVWV